MDVESGTTDISDADNLSGASVTALNLSVGADPVVAPGANEGSNEHVGDGEGVPLPDAGRELQVGMVEGVSGASSPNVAKEEPMEGVTPDPLAGQTEVVTKEWGAARLRKTGAPAQKASF